VSELRRFRNTPCNDKKQQKIEILLFCNPRVKNLAVDSFLKTNRHKTITVNPEKFPGNLPKLQ